MKTPEQPEEKSEGLSVVWVNSGYGKRTHQPFVSLRVKDQFIQISPEEARDVAMNLLRAAEAAMSDLFIIRFFTTLNDGDVSANELAAALRMFRAIRNEREENASDGTKET